MAEIFERQNQQSAQTFNGVPLGALSGNPAGTVTNLAALVGGGAGQAFGQAIQGGLGAFGISSLPTADPQQMQRQREEAFASRLQSKLGEGKTESEAWLEATEEARKVGGLAPDEYLRARNKGAELRDQEVQRLDKATDFVRKSDAFKNFSKTNEAFEEMREIAKRGKAGEQGANDFALILNGLKVLDPGSVVSQNEMATARYAINGAKQLKLLGVNVNQLTDYAAGRGKQFELTAKQKEKWLKAIAASVDGQRGDLENVYFTARDGFEAGGGNASKFEQSLRSVGDLLQKRAYDSVEELNAAGLISGGRGFDNPATRLKAGIENMPEVYGELLKGAAGAGKGVLMELLFGSDDGEAEKPNLGRMMSPELLDMTLQKSYGTDNAMHARTMDVLYGDNINNAFNTAYKLSAPARRQTRRAKKPPKKETGGGF